MSPASRNAVLLLALLLPVGTFAAADPPPASASDPASVVRRLEREWLDAYEKNDPVAMERIVADDFLITFPDGSQQTKAQILAMIRRPRTGPPRTTRFRTEEVRTVVRPNTVILMGVLVTTMVRDGKPVEDRSRYTDTWVHGPSGWQVLASGLSQWAPPRPAAPARPDTSRSTAPDSTR